MPTPALFDFRDPLPMPAAASRLVAGLAEATPRVGLLLGSVAGRSVPTSCAGVRRVALVEVASPGTVWMPAACGLPDPGLVLIAADASVALADLLMGGAGLPEMRRSTRLEQQLLGRCLVPALRPLTDALADEGVTALSVGPVTDEPLPVGLGEVLAVGVDVALPSGSSARVTLCLPAKSLLPGEPEQAELAPVSVGEHVLADVPVEVALRLPATVVTAEDVDDLAPGDVIRLDPEAAASLIGVLDGGDGLALHVLTAALGRRGKRRAVVVHDLLGDR
ncbi:MAG: FliM/FliN family flagellar motor switch protein [Actinomycetota bacterium]|nr:FliM/FliN family flagellar motor switch protein [Actinomycetota bacterium]